MREPKLTAGEVAAFLEEVFPQVRGELAVEAVGPMSARLRLDIAERHLRPGGTVSGPTMFLLADCAFYVAVLGMAGRVPLAVTSGATINYLRKPAIAPMRCEARILRLGRTLATGDATVFSDGVEGPVAHAVLTYAMPRET